jgi:hypothetical protein
MTEIAKDGWSVRSLWEKYEDIAMHFNDLLIRLRMQALGVVAALSALVGIFTKIESKPITWEIAALIFAGLLSFWVAIWILDFAYYNRLLIGAVSALLELEEFSKTNRRIDHINMSTMIGRAVSGKIKHRLGPTLGIWSFYGIVAVALFLGCLFALYKHVTEQGT